MDFADSLEKSILEKKIEHRQRWKNYTDIFVFFSALLKLSTITAFLFKYSHINSIHVPLNCMSFLFLLQK